MPNPFDRGLLAEYPPGSPFKILTGLVGLQEGVVNTETTFLPVVMVFHMAGLSCVVTVLEESSNFTMEFINHVILILHKFIKELLKNTVNPKLELTNGISI